jgi:protocatechuate 4,5-dioxygenase beta chain
MWVAARGALTGRVSSVHSNYHIPISNTAAGLMVMENLSNAMQGRRHTEVESA